MANPQKEKGYVPIANELLDAICWADLSKRELKVLLCIIRFTYGYNKKQSLLSLQTIQEYTGIFKPHISSTIAELQRKNIIVYDGNSYTQPRTFEIQKDYEKWCSGVTKTVTVTESVTVTEMVMEGLPKRSQRGYQIGNPTYKDNIKDSIIQTKGASERKSESDDGDFIPEWFEQIWQQYPLKRGKSEIGKKHFLELKKAGLERVQNALENYLAELRKNTWQHPMHGSRFFKGAWRDYEAQDKPTGSSRGKSAQEILESMRKEDKNNGKP